MPNKGIHPRSIFILKNEKDKVKKLYDLKYASERPKKTPPTRKNHARILKFVV